MHLRRAPSGTEKIGGTLSIGSYAVGNVLLAVEVGAGITVRSPA